MLAFSNMLGPGESHTSLCAANKSTLKYASKLCTEVTNEQKRGGMVSLQWTIS